jgi:hypothetical protein
MKTEKAAPRNEQILDGCTRAKLAAIALKRMGCVISQVTVGGKYPSIKIDTPPAGAIELKGERVGRFLGAGGVELASYIAQFMYCRVGWTEPLNN